MPPTSSSSSAPAPFAPAAKPLHPRKPRFTATERAVRWLRRMTFLVHRWLGIGLALLMAMWAISGIVMMYVAFPETTREERLAGLQPLALQECCETGQMPRAVAIGQAAVEMLAGRPVLRWRGPEGESIVDLATGARVDPDEQTIAAIAETHMRQTTGALATYSIEPIDRDQWTVLGSFRALAPLYKASFEDEAGTHLYISGANGQVVQDTTAHERFWNWLGAVPHWLYFSAIREIQPLWYNLVVYASLLGTFLTVTGIYVGIRQYGRGSRKSGRKSPYHGLSLWHHWTGLIFGIFTLTWVVSGLFSMQPWGLLESRSGPAGELQALAGRPIVAGDVERLLAALQENGAKGAARAEISIQRGQPFALLSYADGSQVRASLPDLAPRPLKQEELATLAAMMRPVTPVASQGLIREPDAYHYGHKEDVALPAWRIIYDDEEQARFYFDPRTGELLSYADSSRRAFRWLHLGLHRLDLSAALRQRPVWDIVVLPLMIGVSLLCLVGLFLGIRRVVQGKPKAHRHRTAPAPQRGDAKGDAAGA